MTGQSNPLNEILMNLELGADGIYSSEFANTRQEKEIALRENVAADHYDDYLAAISRYHSIPVMDWEVSRALGKLSENVIILDVGGCWGWHWRKIAQNRPDIKVVIIDFIRQNLIHAQALLGELLHDQIFLVHGDATQLPFPDDTFDLVWTVQTLQHIPNFESAVQESHRVLTVGGTFINYSFNRALLIEFIFKLFRKKYHIKGHNVTMYLALASNEQKQIIEYIFGNEVYSRFTEILFHPDIKFSLTGKENNLLGRLDAWLGGSLFLLRWLARQQSYEVLKL